MGGPTVLGISGEVLDIADIMENTNHEEWADTALSTLLRRLALQGAAELMDAALDAYLAAEAMTRGER